MREIDKFKRIPIGIMSALVAHEAGLRYKAWKKGLKKPVTHGEALLKYHFFNAQVIKEFQKEGKL